MIRSLAKILLGVVEAYECLCGCHPLPTDLRAFQLDSLKPALLPAPDGRDVHRPVVAQARKSFRGFLQGQHFLVADSVRHRFRFPVTSVVLLSDTIILQVPGDAANLAQIEVDIICVGVPSRHSQRPVGLFTGNLVVSFAAGQYCGKGTSQWTVQRGGLMARVKTLRYSANWRRRSCPFCGGIAYRKRVLKRTVADLGEILELTYAQLQCGKCGRLCIHQSAEDRLGEWAEPRSRFSRAVVAKAILLHERGLSITTISEQLWSDWGVDVSRRTIQKWIKKHGG